MIEIGALIVPQRARNASLCHLVRTLRVRLGKFRKREVGSEEEGPLQPDVDYTVDYRGYTRTKLLDDLKKSVCWGDAQEMRATLSRQFKVEPGEDLVVAPSGDFELNLEVVDKVHVCHVITSTLTH